MGIIEWIVGRVLTRARPPKMCGPTHFAQHGISFDHPRNWQPGELDELEDGCLYVDLNTAMGNFCSITTMVPNTGMELH